MTEEDDFHPKEEDLLELKNLIDKIVATPKAMISSHPSLISATSSSLGDDVPLVSKKRLRMSDPDSDSLEDIPLVNLAEKKHKVARIAPPALETDKVSSQSTQPCTSKSSAEVAASAGASAPRKAKAVSRKDSSPSPFPLGRPYTAADDARLLKSYRESVESGAQSKHQWANRLGKELHRSSSAIMTKIYRLQEQKPALLSSPSSSVESSSDVPSDELGPHEALETACSDSKGESDDAGNSLVSAQSVAEPLKNTTAGDGENGVAGVTADAAPAMVPDAGDLQPGAGRRYGGGNFHDSRDAVGSLAQKSPAEGQLPASSRSQTENVIAEVAHASPGLVPVKEEVPHPGDSEASRVHHHALAALSTVQGGTNTGVVRSARDGSVCIQPRLTSAVKEEVSPEASAGSLLPGDLENAAAVVRRFQEALALARLQVLVPPETERRTGSEHAQASSIAAGASSQSNAAAGLPAHRMLSASQRLPNSAAAVPSSQMQSPQLAQSEFAATNTTSRQSTSSHPVRPIAPQAALSLQPLPANRCEQEGQPATFAGLAAAARGQAPDRVSSPWSTSSAVRAPDASARGAGGAAPRASTPFAYEQQWREQGGAQALPPPRRTLQHAILESLQGGEATPAAAQTAAPSALSHAASAGGEVASSSALSARRNVQEWPPIPLPQQAVVSQSSTQPGTGYQFGFTSALGATSGARTDAVSDQRSVASRTAQNQGDPGPH